MYFANRRSIFDRLMSRSRHGSIFATVLSSHANDLISIFEEIRVISTVKNSLRVRPSSGFPERAFTGTEQNMLQVSFTLEVPENL